MTESRPTIDTILKRKSIRSFRPDPVPEEQRRRILEAMLRAPSAGNQMLYSVIEVEDQHKKEELARSCDNQPFISRSPWVLIFLADMQRMLDFFELSGVHSLVESGAAESVKAREADLLLASCDALIAAQTAVLAAESLALGSCYIGDVMENYEFHRDLLQLPDYCFPIAMLCLGYPTEQQQRRPPTERIAADKIIFTDRYRRLTPDELRHLYDHNIPRRPRFVDGAKNIGQDTYLRKFSSPFMMEMRRSVKAMLAHWS
ncbi:MAG TPA: nitroreductase [Sediminispirochaeta sp.]|nr:nitroreductase [Sediminispirochaeta sp.]